MTTLEIVKTEAGVNEYAAKGLLDSLRELRGYLASSPAINEPPLAAMLQRADAAIARGEGRLS